MLAKVGTAEDKTFGEVKAFEMLSTGTCFSSSHGVLPSARGCVPMLDISDDRKAGLILVCVRATEHVQQQRFL